jgi:aspartyl/asparaginyl-tRNA synthetase
VFVTGFPFKSRPSYTHPASDGVHAAGFDLLMRGLEVTIGGDSGCIAAPIWKPR